MLRRNIIAGSPRSIRVASARLEHPMGKMDVIVDFEMNGTEFNHKSAGLIRTCRKIAEGLVYVPTEIWEGEKK